MKFAVISSRYGNFDKIIEKYDHAFEDMHPTTVVSDSGIMYRVIELRNLEDILTLSLRVKEKLIIHELDYFEDVSAVRCGGNWYPIIEIYDWYRE